MAPEHTRNTERLARNIEQLARNIEQLARNIEKLARVGAASLHSTAGNDKKRRDPPAPPPWFIFLTDVYRSTNVAEAPAFPALSVPIYFPAPAFIPLFVRWFHEK